MIRFKKKFFMKKILVVFLFVKKGKVEIGVMLDRFEVVYFGVYCEFIYRNLFELFVVMVFFV